MTSVPKRIFPFILFTILFVINGPSGLYAQEDYLPKDYLSTEFHTGRRAALRKIMPDNSVLVVFAFPTRIFSNDVEYLYHQNPDMYYFSGYKEPHSLLMIFKNEQTDSAGNKFSEVLFVQKRNPQTEQWAGKRLGVEGAKERSGIQLVFNGEMFQQFDMDFSKFTKIIFDRFPANVPVNNRATAELAQLIKQFKQKTGIPDDYSKDTRFDNRLFRELTGKLREIKTAEEMVLLRKALKLPVEGCLRAHIFTLYLWMIN